MEQKLTSNLIGIEKRVDPGLKRLFIPTSKEGGDKQPLKLRNATSLCHMSVTIEEQTFKLLIFLVDYLR